MFKSVIQDLNARLLIYLQLMIHQDIKALCKLEPNSWNKVILKDMIIIEVFELKWYQRYQLDLVANKYFRKEVCFIFFIREKSEKKRKISKCNSWLKYLQKCPEITKHLKIIIFFPQQVTSKNFCCIFLDRYSFHFCKIDLGSLDNLMLYSIIYSFQSTNLKHRQFHLYLCKYWCMYRKLLSKFNHLHTIENQNILIGSLFCNNQPQPAHKDDLLLIDNIKELKLLPTIYVRFHVCVLPVH